MRILVISAIDPVAIDVLSSRHEVVQVHDPQPTVLLQLVVDADVLVFRSGVTISAEVLDAAPALRLLVRAGAGTDNVDIAAVRARGIRLATIPAPGAKAVAEMAFALMLSLARNVIVADQLTRQGRWAKHQLTGQALHGRTLGIVGAGNIGSRVGRLGALWGMTVLGCVEHPSGDVAEALAWCGIRLTDLPEVLRSSDYVSVHVPLKESTRYLIDAAALARMNMILHGHPTAEIARGNTLAAPAFKNRDGSLRTFDFAVANPPFSAKAWSSGLDPAHDEFRRFEYGSPPARNGDYAFLLHLVTSLRNEGKGAIILPHGVLFRGNREADIRRNLIERQKRQCSRFRSRQQNDTRSVLRREGKFEHGHQEHRLRHQRKDDLEISTPEPGPGHSARLLQLIAQLNEIGLENLRR